MSALAGLVGVYRRLPAPLRARLKKILSASGHAPGFAQRLRAKNLARGAKRLDLLAEQTLPMLAAAGVESLRGKAILEFGSGHLLAEPMLYWLLGAARVHAIDYFPILQMREIGAPVAATDPARLRAAITRHGDVALFDERWPKLRGIGKWRADDFAGFGWRYVSPVDMRRGDDRLGRYDLILSNSVLEHVPADAAAAILGNLFALLNPGGAMIHNIHLEDHFDPAYAPHAFLAADSDYAPEQADERGNRLRASDWLRLHRYLPGARVDIIAQATRPEATLPSRLAPEFAGYDADDLSLSQIVICARDREPSGSNGSPLVMRV